MGGLALAELLQPVARPLRVVGGAALVVLAVVRFLRSRRDGAQRSAHGAIAGQEAAARAAGAASAFAAFLGLTLLNPLTIMYFAALVVGGQQLLPSTAARAVFVGAAFAASLSWQWGLAGLGAGARGRLPAQANTVMAAAGNVLVLGLGAWMAAGAL